MKFPIQTHSLANYRALADGYERLRWHRRAIEMHTAIVRRWPGTAQSRGSRRTPVVLKQSIERKGTPGKPAAEVPEGLPPAAKVRPEAVKETDIYEG